MAYKTYPVRLFYYYNRAGQRVWHTDKWDAYNAAYAHAQLHKIPSLAVSEVLFPRTLNAENALKLITGRFGSFESKVFSKVYYHPRPKTEQPQASIDPYDLLGITNKASLTKESLRAFFTEAAKRFHPDKGGSNAAMQAVNAANDRIKKENRW